MADPLDTSDALRRLASLVLDLTLDNYPSGDVRQSRAHRLCEALEKASPPATPARTVTRAQVEALASAISDAYFSPVGSWEAVARAALAHLGIPTEEAP